MHAQAHTVENALDQLRPKLDAYRDGQLSMTDITQWLSSYEAEVQLNGSDATWEEASRRMWVLLSEIESGYGTKAAIHQGLDAIARNCAKAA